MKLFQIFLLLAMLASIAPAAQPTITEITNAASYMPPGLPSAGVAQGAMFVVKGTNLGPTALLVANSFPLATTLGGTSITIQVGGQPVSAIMYYTSANQLAAILPSSIPPGNQTVKVNYLGNTATGHVTVLPHAVGIFTISTSGAGDAVAYLGYSLVTPSNSPNPGEVVSFWGTGLGPVSSDETMPAQQMDMPDVPVQAYVGGLPANVVFRGRNACCSSIDAIYIQIPAGVTGCLVPVVFEIGNVVSNTTTIPIANSGRVCTATNPAFSSVDLGSLLGMSSFSVGTLTLTHEADTTPTTSTQTGGTVTTDSGSAAFIRFTKPAGGTGLASALDIAPYGTCIGNTAFNPGGYVPVPPNQTYLDAGTRIELTGPNGALPMNQAVTGSYISYNVTLLPNVNFLTSGRYTLAGTGGADIGSFSASMTLPSQLTWTNQSSITNIDRTAGVTVTWTGGDPAGYVAVTGQSFASSGNANVAASFVCSARTSDGSFTVPPLALATLPAGSSATLSVTEVSAPAAVQASGLNYGALSGVTISSTQVTYQ